MGPDLQRRQPGRDGLLRLRAGCGRPDEDWREAVRRILVDDWRFQFNEWNQSPWAYVWRPGLVSVEEAMAWRAEAWEGHEDIDQDSVEEEEPAEDESVRGTP